MQCRLSSTLVNLLHKTLRSPRKSGNSLLIEDASMEVRCSLKAETTTTLGLEMQTGAFCRRFRKVQPET